MLLVCLPALTPAALLRIEVQERSAVLDNVSFGRTGSYERIIGRAYFAVDPKLAPNRIITDIDKAPRNEKGLVEFSADLYVLKPRDPALGNGGVLFAVWEDVVAAKPFRGEMPASPARAAKTFRGYNGSAKS